MVAPMEAMFALLPPAVILISGWSMHVLIRSPKDKPAVSSLYLESLLLGSVLYVVPFIILGVLGLSLRLFTMFYLVAAIATVIAAFYSRRPQLTSDCRAITSLVHTLRSSENLLYPMALLALTVYFIKICFECLFGPIITGDALTFWLSTSKMLFNVDSIPVVDPYHFYRYSAEPVVPALFSLGFFLSGSTEIEAFRGMSILFFAALPLLAHRMVMGYSGNRSGGLLSAVIVCFLPMTDFMAFAYLFYADVFAVVFAVLSLTLFRKSLAETEGHTILYVGVSLAMCILSKYAIGLLTGFIILLEVMWSMTETRLPKYMLLLSQAAMVCALILWANAVWGFLANPVAIGILLFLLCLTLLPVMSGANHMTQSFRWLGRFNLMAAAGFIPALLWGVRSAMIGAAPFGIELLRAVPLSEDELTIAGIIEMITPLSSSASRYTLLTPVGFIFHPLLNGYLAGLVLIWTLRTRSGYQLLRLLILLYLGYITVMGYFPSGRHLLYASIALAALIGHCFTVVPKNRWAWLRIGASTFALLYIFFALFQSMTLSVALGVAGLDEAAYGLTPYVPHSTTFDLYTSADIVIKLGLGGVAVTVLVLVVLQSQKLVACLGAIAVKKSALAVLFLFCAASVLPVGYYAIQTTSGDIFEYDMMGSWNRGDFAFAEALAPLVNKSDVILAYGDLVLSYLEYRVIDLYRQGLYNLPSIVNSTDSDAIYTEVSRIGIRYLVLPSNSSYLYTTYLDFLAVVPYPDVLAASGHSVYLFTIGGWSAYRLI